MKTILFLLLFLLSVSTISYGQCRWKNVDTLDFENTLIDTGIVATSVYHTSPQTYAVRTGLRGLYFNIQNGPPPVAAGALLYHRTFPVCVNRPYQFSFYYTTCFSGTLCDLTIKLYDGPTLINTVITGPIPVQNWQQYLPPTFIPTNPIIKVEIYTNVAGTGAGNDAGIDDMVLKGCTQKYNDSYFLCLTNTNYNLYDSIPLANMNNSSGTWSGPSPLLNGYLGTYNPASNTNGTYLYTFPAASNRCFADSAVLVVNTIVCGNTCPILTVTNDTTICANATLQLNAQLTSGAIQNVVWSPSTGLSNATIANPTTTATANTSYQVTVTSVSPISLIANGDFSQGNASFSSGYTYCSASVPPVPCTTTWGLLSCGGFYTISTNPNACHTNFSTFGDHTTGTGNMFIVNGATNPNISVWCQTVPVIANTNYNFSAWFSNVDPISSAASLPQLHFEINGVTLGPVFAPVITTGVWTNHGVIWNSGANTTATICIQNSAINNGGNDFALDDVSFNATCILIDTVSLTIKHAPTVVFPNDTAFCNTVNLVINPTVTGNPTPTYLWQNGSTANTFTATNFGTYSMTATNSCGSATDSLHVAVTSSPTSVSLGSHLTICNQASYTLTPIVTGSAIYYVKWQDSSTTATFNATTSGTYYVRIYNDCGSVWDTVSLFFKTSPTVQLGANQVLCNQASYTILPTVTGSANLNYKWQDSSTTSTFNTNATGLYYVRTYNECGSVWDTVRITFKVSPTVQLGNTLSFCDVNSYSLSPTVTGSSLLQYKWQDSSTLSSYNVLGSGLYYVRVYNQCGSVWDTVRVVFNYSPTVNLGVDKLVCDSFQHLITPYLTGTTPISLVWQNGSPNPIFYANQTANYIVTATNLCSSDMDTVRITFSISPTVTFTQHTIKKCDFDPITLSPIVGGTTPISYSWNTGLLTPSIQVNNSGIYILTVSNVCSSQLDTVAVAMIPVPTPVYDGAVLTICLDSSIIFNAQNIGSSYLWNTKDTTQKIFINKPGFYTVKITEQSFCSIIDSVHLLMVDCNPGYVFMPNAFSPNGDGFNDNIGPILIGENVKLTGYKVYNRWGSLIFASNEKGMNWDGKYNGVDQLVGTYIYTVDYTNMGVPKLLKGNISLIR